MPVWRTIGKSRWLVEARQLPWTITAGIALLFVSAFLCLWPADFDLESDGKLQPAVRAQVFAELDGRITKVHVEHGTMVKKGDLLAEMENSDLEKQMAEAQGKLAESLDELAGVREQIAHPSRSQPGEEFQLKGAKRPCSLRFIARTCN